MKTAVIFISFAVLAACGPSEQTQTAQAPYAAETSPDARGSSGYPSDTGYWGENGGEEGGRGSAATGATEQGLEDLPAGDPSRQQQPAREGEQP
jgi:hypothetical protein